MNRYRCSKSGYIYDPQRGDPSGGITPGTPFLQVPESWRCPRCGANKNAFAALPAEVSAASAEPATANAEAAAESAPKPSAPAHAWTVGSLKKI